VLGGEDLSSSLAGPRRLHTARQVCASNQSQACCQGRADTGDARNQSQAHCHTKTKPAKKAVQANAKPSAPTKPVAKKKPVAEPMKPKPVRSQQATGRTHEEGTNRFPKSGVPAAKKKTVAVSSQGQANRSVAKKARYAARRKQTLPNEVDSRPILQQREAQR